MFQWLDIEPMIREVAQRDLERRLEIARLLADAYPNPSGLRQRVLARLGDALIATGERLRPSDERHAAMLEA